MAPEILPVVVELHFAKGSVVREGVTSVGETRVEWGEDRAPIFVRGIVDGKVRVGQRAGIAGG